jgi:hypothetical protein
VPPEVRFGAAAGWKSWLDTTATGWSLAGRPLLQPWGGPTADPQAVWQDELAALNAHLNQYPVGPALARRAYGLLYARAMAGWAQQGHWSAAATQLTRGLAIAPHLGYERRFRDLLAAARAEPPTDPHLFARAVLGTLEQLSATGDLTAPQRQAVYVPVLLQLGCHSLRHGVVDRFFWFWQAALDRLPNRRDRWLAVLRLIQHKLVEGLLG